MPPPEREGSAGTGRSAAALTKILAPESKFQSAIRSRPGDCQQKATSPTLTRDFAVQFF